MVPFLSQSVVKNRIFLINCTSHPIRKMDLVFFSIPETKKSKQTKQCSAVFLSFNFPAFRKGSSTKTEKKQK